MAYQIPEQFRLTGTRLVNATQAHAERGYFGYGQDFDYGVALVAFSIIFIMFLYFYSRKRNIAHKDNLGNVWNYVCNDNIGNKYFTNLSSAMAQSVSLSTEFNLAFIIKKQFGKLEQQRIKNIIADIRVQHTTIYATLFIYLKIIGNKKYCAIAEEIIYLENGTEVARQTFDKNHLNFNIISEDNPISKTYNFIRKNVYQ